MEELKKLVEDFFEYTKEISISEFELYDLYCDKLEENYKKMYEKWGTLQENIEKMIKEDILYDFVFNINGIIFQLKNDIGNYAEESKEYKYIEEIYKEIKTIFKDFKIEILEK